MIVVILPKISIFFILFNLSAKLVPLAYGINKLQISCVVEDEKVSVDWLQEAIQENEDYVSNIRQSYQNNVTPYFLYAWNWLEQRRKVVKGNRSHHSH